MTFFAVPFSFRPIKLATKFPNDNNIQSFRDTKMKTHMPKGPSGNNLNRQYCWITAMLVVQVFRAPVNGALFFICAFVSYIRSISRIVSSGLIWLINRISRYHRIWCRQVFGNPMLNTTLLPTEALELETDKSTDKSLPDPKKLIRSTCFILPNQQYCCLGPTVFTTLGLKLSK